MSLGGRRHKSISFRSFFERKKIRKLAFSSTLRIFKMGTMALQRVGAQENHKLSSVHISKRNQYSPRPPQKTGARIFRY